MIKRIKEQILNKLKEIRKKGVILRPARLKSIIHKIKIRKK